jgi:hypothetical protein
MSTHSTDEVVFEVAGAAASAAQRVTLTESGLKEREHLQAWVVDNPEILGPGMMIVTFEFDHWFSAAGPQKDRLDVLGLGSDGRLVVAELKRGEAPDTVEMQALKYAAMASRFSPDLLAEYHAAYMKKAGPADSPSAALTQAEALAKLETHSDVGLLSDQLVNPRVVLLAEGFPPSVTATAVWLNERGVDLVLMRYQAYLTESGQIVLTVSQLYPVREVADFEVAPHSSAKTKAPTLPELPWSEQDLGELASVANATTLAILDLCALSPDAWVPAGSVYARADVSVASGTGQLGGFGLTVRARFKRSNPPYEREWSADGINQACYRMGADQAQVWRQVRGADLPTPVVNSGG